MQYRGQVPSAINASGDLCDKLDLRGLSLSSVHSPAEGDHVVVGFRPAAGNFYASLAAVGTGTSLA